MMHEDRSIVKEREFGRETRVHRGKARNFFFRSAARHKERAERFGSAVTEETLNPNSRETESLTSTLSSTIVYFDRIGTMKLLI